MKHKEIRNIDAAIYNQLQRTAEWIDEYYDCPNCKGAPYCKEGKYCYKDYFYKRGSAPDPDKLPTNYKWLKGVIL